MVFKVIIFKVDIFIMDMDCNYYNDYNFIIVCYFFENDEWMMLCVVVFIVNVYECL